MASLKSTITAALRQTGSTTTRCVMGGEGRGGGRGACYNYWTLSVLMD